MDSDEHCAEGNYKRNEAYYILISQGCARNPMTKTLSQKEQRKRKGVRANDTQKEKNNGTNNKKRKQRIFWNKGRVTT